MAEPPQQLNYNRHYIGLTDGVRARNFVYFRPRKKHVWLAVEVQDPDAWVTRLSDLNIESQVREGELKIMLAPAELKRHREIFAGLLHEAVGLYQS